MTNFLFRYSILGLFTGIIFVVLAKVLSEKTKKPGIILRKPTFAIIVISIVWPVIWVSFLMTILGINLDPIIWLKSGTEKIKNWFEKKYPEQSR